MPSLSSLFSLSSCILASLSCRPGRYIAGLCLACGLASITIPGCTQEQQNTISRKILNWTGTKGVLDVFSNGKLMYRIIHIDKLSTATASSGNEARPYRYGYGVMDLNFNYIQDPNEHRTYFEMSEFSTPYIFYENPIDVAGTQASPAGGSGDL